MIKTGFSFHNAVGHLPEVASRIKELGWEEGPIADKCSTFGHVRWRAVCEQTGLRPVYGVELAVVAVMGEKRPVIDYWVFLARDSLRPLNDLIGLATLNPGAEPSLSYDQAQDTDGLVVITGERCLVDQVDWGREQTYMGLSPATPSSLYRAGVEAKARLLAMPRNVYPRADDLELYRVTLGRRASTQTYPQHIVSDEELRASIDWFAEHKITSRAIDTRRRVLSHCKAKLEQAVILSPPKPKTLRQMCLEGAKRLGVDLKDHVYKARLEKELGLIAEKKFEDYFYVIADLVTWAKARMIVGPARGSSCGSLACYLLGITAIDPIPHGLIFERFIDITRADLPDIDLDFSDAKRHEVFEYCEEKYGDKMARLGSIGLYQVKSAIKQMAVSLRIPDWEAEKVGETAIKRMMGDSRKSSTILDTLNDTDAGQKFLEKWPEAIIVARMEGHPHNASQHAAGVVVTDKPVTEYVAVNHRTGTVMCDKYDAEALNLLKIDALGLTQLSVFERTLELIGEEPKCGFLEKLPIDDKQAFEVLNERRFCGIFQFLGNAMRSMCNDITFKTLDDIVAATALVRPGPLASGGTNEWIYRHEGKRPVTYPHSILEPYMRDTYGVVVYQEQILQIGREVGDLSWADVTALRKGMSKSLGKEYFDKWGDKWQANAVKKGMSPELAEKFWGQMCNFGAWAFNKAHSVGYAYLSYWCCWLKAHHPLEFAAATLDAEALPERQIELLRELDKEGIKYTPVDVELSTDLWIPIGGNEKRLIGPLTTIHGIGPSTVRDILSARKTGKPLRPVVAKKLVGKPITTIDDLWPISKRVRELCPDGLRAAGIETEQTKIKEIQKLEPEPEPKNGKRVWRDGRVVLIIGIMDRIVPIDENEPVRVQRRGRRLEGQTKALNLFVRDDSDQIFCKINCKLFDNKFKGNRQENGEKIGIGREVMERGKPGRAIYAIKGEAPADFRMVDIRRIKYLGDFE